MNEELTKKLELIRKGEALEDEYEDHPQGPYFFDNGMPWLSGQERVEAMKNFVAGSTSGLRCGGAPAHHPKRCHDLSTRRQRRCERWALQGRLYCVHHSKKRAEIRLRRRFTGLPKMYKELLCPRLQDRLEKFLASEEREKQLLAYEEIALARTLLTNDIELYTALVNAKDNGNNTTITSEHVMVASRAVSNGLTAVVDLCSKVARIEKDLQDRVSASQLGAFVTSVASIIHARLGETEEAQQLIEDLRLKAELPEDPDAAPDLNFINEITISYD